MAEPMHNFLVFHCNYKGEDGSMCHRQVDQGWVTACCHIFCQEHSEEWFKSRDDCPLCKDGHVKLVKVDVSRTNSLRRSRTALIVLAPPDLMQVVETAFNFWVDQKLFEHTHRESNVKDLFSRLQRTEAKIQRKLAEMGENSARALADQSMIEHKIEDVMKAIKNGERQIIESKRALEAEEDRYANLTRQIQSTPRRDTFVDSGDGARSGGASRQEDLQPHSGMGLRVGSSSVRRGSGRELQLRAPGTAFRGQVPPLVSPFPAQDAMRGLRRDFDNFSSLAQQRSTRRFAKRDATFDSCA